MPMTNNTFMILIIALFFVFLFAIVYGISRFLQSRANQRRIIQRIQNDAHNDHPQWENRNNPTESKKSAPSFLSLLTFLGKKALNQSNVDGHTGRRLKFLKAGIKSQHAQATFWGAKCVLCLLLPIAFIMIRFVFLLQLVNINLSLMVFLVLALIGFYAPDFWLHTKSKHRKEDLLKGFPDALDLLVICVEAGMGIDNAFNRVAREIKLSHPALSDEFTMMNLEMRAGNSRKNALKNLAMRTDLDEMGSLSAMLIQTDTFGTSISAALKIFSESLKEKRYQRAEEIAAKMPVKLMLPLILFIFPALFVVLLGPAAITIYENIILK